MTSSHMTMIKGAPDTSVVVPGMAHFAGTGPAAKTCGDCVFRGYKREAVHGKWDARLQMEVYRNYRVQKCSKFKSLTGNHGPDIAADNRSCKYFQQRQE
jgi:hypothetical protein